CLLRGIEAHADADTPLVPPYRIFDVARGAGLLFHVDLAARRAAIRQASRHGIDCRIFINFTPTAIYDPVNCLRSTVLLVHELGLHPEQIVFEVIESELVTDVDHLNTILDYYRNSGFGVALDDLGSGYSSLNLLARLRPDYIKLDRELITDVVNDPFKAMIARKLLEAAQELKIQTIAEGIETQDEADWLREQGANYMQGYFIARPAAKPPLQPPAHA
ncbi:MAG: hypothetical protein JWN98_1953, partial [Abditibacteriota bacterium]|nr:hypothetical protein [Abditibacteriota bacterium]